ncbi:MAG: sulfotransferase, partial [Gammaproteobacteria bacterium]|nr:sulfotransferase [Gammaproteobacteria bacterium]
QLEHLLSLPKPLIAVMDLVAQGKLLKAEELCKKFMRQVPHNVEGMRLLADIAIRLGVLEEAEYLLESALELEPANTRARIDYIGALRKRQQYDKALSAAKILLESQPDNLQFKSLFAIECMQSGNFDRALTVFDEILQSLPADPVTLTSKGHALKTKGDSDKAVACYHAAINANHGHGEAFYSLANLKTYRFNESEVAAMAALSNNSNLSFMDRVYINFALGKAYEDIGNYTAAFEHYQSGNALKKSQSRYQADRMTEELAAQKNLFTKDFLESQNGAGHPAKDPIFILGLPRAGSTLLEQILSSHSEIDGTLELPNILSLSQRLRRKMVEDTTPGYPAILKRLNAENFASFGKEYIEDTFCHRQGARRFIDKMPNNFRHIGLIKLILPNAKIIDARRNPLDCCWSGYKQLFAEGQEFTYDLSDIGQYYRDYVDLMSHWDNVIPEFVLRVNNEDVIEDLEGQVQRILEFCELPFEESCLNFHQTQRNVRTPSADQVRKPVSRAGVAQWKPFEAHLAPLQKALGEELTQLSYEHTETSY